MRLSKLLGSIVFCAGLLGSSAARATDYNDSGANDFSGDRLNPTLLTLTNGSNHITATSGGGDLEYFRLAVPAGLRLSQIVVVSNTAPGVSFIGVQVGNTFTEPPSGTDVANLLGYAHFGTSNGTIGTNILDDMSTAAGAIHFTPPLGAGNYTFWSQDTGGAVTYQLDFQVTAVPQAPLPRPALALLAAALAGCGFWRFRIRHRAARATGP